MYFYFQVCRIPHTQRRDVKLCRVQSLPPILCPKLVPHHPDQHMIAMDVLIFSFLFWQLNEATLVSVNVVTDSARKTFLGNF